MERDPILRTLIIPETDPELPGYKLEISGGLHYIRGNSAPYFSITADLKRPRGGWDSGGCQHDLISHYTGGHFDDLIALHLSDIDGVPMHAVENGWYWLGKTKWQDRNDKVLAEHLRIPLETAKLLAFANKEKFAEYVDAQRSRWVAEARLVASRHNLHVYGDADHWPLRVAS